MNDDIDILYSDAEKKMEGAISHLSRELSNIRAGKADPQMLDSIMVDYYGTKTKLSQVSNINTPDPRSIVIQPWEKNMLEVIEKAILTANLGFNPQNDGAVIRINVPQLTEERRKELVKKVRNEGENSRVSVRNIRRDAIDSAKKLEKQGLPEDDVKIFEKSIQELTNKFTDKIEELLKNKEDDIMNI